MKKAVKEPVLVLLMVMLSWNASAKTITVNGGGEAAIESAINASSTVAGDVIVVNPGNYDDTRANGSGTLKITKSGTRSAPITLKAANPATTTTNSALRTRVGNINVENASHWNIEGFEIADQLVYNTVEIEGTSQNIALRKLLIHDVIAGIKLQEGSGHVVQDCRIYNTINRDGATVNGAFSHEAHNIVIVHAKGTLVKGNDLSGFIGDGIQFYNDGNEVPHDRGTTIVEGNTIHNTMGGCAENAVDIKSEGGTVIVRKNKFFGFRGMRDTDCTYWSSGEPEGAAVLAHRGGSVGTLVVEQNEFYDMFEAVDARLPNVTIRNNIFHDFVPGKRADNRFIDLGVIVPNYVEGNRQKVYHNTFVNCPRLFRLGPEFSLTAAQSPEVINNLFWDVGGTIPSTYSHNGWFGQSMRQSGSGDVTGTNPLLNTDYSLTSGSPLIDEAQSIGIANDYADVSRPQGPASDIGAFEFNGVQISPLPPAVPTGVTVE